MYTTDFAQGIRGKTGKAMGKVDEISEAVGIVLGLRKCAVAHARGRGEVVRRGPLRLKPGTCVCEIDQDQGDTWESTSS